MFRKSSFATTKGLSTLVNQRLIYFYSAVWVVYRFFSYSPLLYLGGGWWGRGGCLYFKNLQHFNDAPGCINSAQGGKMKSQQSGISLCSHNSASTCDLSGDFNMFLPFHMCSQGQPHASSVTLLPIAAQSTWQGGEMNGGSAEPNGTGKEAVWYCLHIKWRRAI